MNPLTPTHAAPLADEPPAVAEPSNGAAIFARDISKSFSDHRALKSVNLRLEYGTRLALMGPNGAGKTTLLRVLATLVRPSAGELEIAGFEATRDDQEIRRRIGVVLHEALLYPDLSVVENLNFYARLYHVVDARDRVADLIAELALQPLAARRVRHLSHGQRKRATLARALIHNPSILLLDEPDSGLDPLSLERIQAILVADPRRCVVFATHQTSTALSIGTDVVLLQQGYLHVLGPTAALSHTDIDLALAAARS